ncbi:MAG: flavin reductase [Eubacteriaceae bacterium]|nr:flavin reductase [Eubacteriaceae bacterium]
MDLFSEAFDLFAKKWALLTSGSMDDFNTMTIGWGALGTLWGKSVVTVYVKPARYTHGFMDRNDLFTVSFYSDEYKKDMGTLGKYSGRDTDKIAMTSLTPVEAAGGVSFKEAEVTLVARKIYSQDLDTAKMPEEVVRKTYSDEAPHTMYVGEIVEIIRK